MLPGEEAMTKDRRTPQQIQDAHWSRDKCSRRRPDHPVVRAAFEPMADIVAAGIENPDASSVLDVGCGNGFLQYALERRFGAVMGLDYSRRMLEANPCGEKRLGSCTDLPFADKSFDIAAASHLLHHLNEPDRIRALAEMRRVARWTVVSFEPNRNNPLMFAFALLKREERMALRFSPSYTRELFIEAGLFNVHVHVEGWIAPNKAPVCWTPIGHRLSESPFRKLGFDICTTGRVKPGNAPATK